jgi:[ribosomal protein S18]-alanine N-acetyltransferase
MAIRVEYQPKGVSEKDLAFIDSDCFPGEPMGERFFAAALQGDFWVAILDGALAGFAYLRRREDVSWLSRIATASPYRRRGVATELLGTVLEHCGRIGPPETMLYVRADNATAIRLYERFGFRGVESAYRFVLLDPRERVTRSDRVAIFAKPICDVHASDLPPFPREWANIAAMHAPPETQVLVFCEASRVVGYCRLTPAMGCFPFALERPKDRLNPVLACLSSLIPPDTTALRLTVSDTLVAEACHQTGLTLEYELVKMLRTPGIGR